MKKLIIATVLLLTCLTAAAGPVSSKRAVIVAENFIRFQYGKHGVSIDGLFSAVEVSAPAGVENIHVVNYLWIPNYSSSYLYQGYVIVSGDDIADPVLAFSRTALFGTTDICPAMLAHLQGYGRQIEAAKAKGVQPTASVSRKWQLLETDEWRSLLGKGDINDDYIPNLLGDMRWGQGQPYNDLCPGGSVTGCVATAFGMIMNYWDWPEHGWGQHSYNGENNPAAYPNWTYGELSADFEHTYYDWEHMADYAVINSSDSVKRAISTLLFQIGVSLDMHYTPEGSGCWSLPEYAIFDTSLHLEPTLGADYRIPKHFGYKYSYAGMRDSIGNDSLWMQMLYTSLKEGKPIYYAGWAKDDSEAGHSGTSGHGYILDGYFSDITDSNFFHINWGWSGSYNDYFKLDAMKPSSSDFTQWHGAIIGLEPDSAYQGYNPAAIRPVEVSNALVYSQRDRIVMRQLEGQPVAVFDIMGRRIASQGQRDEWSLSVRPGIYLVRVGNAQSKKIAVIY